MLEAVSSRVRLIGDEEGAQARVSSKMPFQYFADRFAQEKKRGVPELHIIWMFLDEAIREKFSLKKLNQGLNNLKDDPELLMPREVGEAILKTCAMIPAFTDKVTVEEALKPNELAQRMPFYISAKIAKAQIKEVLKSKGIDWNTHLTKHIFAAFMKEDGEVNSVSFDQLFEAKDDEFILRLQVASALAALDNYFIPKHTIELLEKFSKKYRSSPPSPKFPLKMDGDLMSKEPVPLPGVDPNQNGVVKAAAPKAGLQEPAKPRYVGYDEFYRLIMTLETDKCIRLKDVRLFLPQKFRYDLNRFLVARDEAEKRASLKMPSELVTHVMNFFEALPHPSKPAHITDLKIEEKYKRVIKFVMFANVAQEQIAQARSHYKKEPSVLVDEMVALGYSKRHVTLLLDGETSKLVPRKLVAALIQKMNVGHDLVGEQTCAADKLVNVQEIIEPLKKTFAELSGGQDFTPRMVYGHMSSVDKKVIKLSDINQWFKGKITQVPQHIADRFMAAATAKLQSLNLQSQAAQQESGVKTQMWCPT